MHVDLEINAVCLQSPFALSIGVDRFRRACDVCGLDWDKEGDIESERQREREGEGERDTHRERLCEYVRVLLQVRACRLAFH